jgi:type I restriction enzyme R subunit
VKLYDKHDSTANRKFNAIFATASINEAIEYQALFKTIQIQRKESNEEYKSLNIACVFLHQLRGKDIKQSKGFDPEKDNE